MVETATPKIKNKTAYAVLDHITGTLPDPDGTFCEPLRNNYLRSFRIILDSPAIGEHLRPKQWQANVDFVLEAIETNATEDEIDDATPLSREASMSSRYGHSLSMRVSQSSGSRITKVTNTVLEELLGAMRSLSAITNAPLVSRSKAICDTLVQYLTTTARLQETAFEALNNVLLALLTEDVSLAARTFSALVPIMRMLWTTRSSALREQMLSTLVICRDLVTAVHGRPGTVDVSLVQPLVDSMISEYTSRGDKDILQLEDIVFYTTQHSHCLRLRNFCPTSSRSLANTATLSLIASFLLLLHERQNAPMLNGLDEEGPRKRRKLTSLLREALEHVMAANHQARVAYTQIVLFVLEQAPAKSSLVLEYTPAITSSLTDEDGQNVAWMYLLLSR